MEAQGASDRPSTIQYLSVHCDISQLVLTSVKLHVSIGKYWVSLYVLACMVVCIMERIGMYWHGMYYGMYWYVLFLVCITCIGKYWYVFRGHMCKYSYVLVSIGMYRKMVCIVHTGKYCYVLVYIDLY